MLLLRSGASPPAYPVLPEPDVPRGFITEAKEYEFVLALPSLSADELWKYRVFCGDTELPHYARRSEHFFPWSVDFYAGEIRVALFREDACLAERDIVVDPALAKLTRDQYISMLRDIAMDTRALHQLADVRVPAAVAPAAARLDIATLELLRIRMDRLRRALEQVDRSPVRVLTRSSALRAIGQIRNVTAREFTRSLRSRNLRPASDSERQLLSPLVDRLGGQLPRTIETVSKRDSLDVYENQAIRQFLRWADAVLVDALRRLEVPAEEPDAVRQAWQRRIKHLRSNVLRLTRLPLFADVQRTTTSLHPSPVFKNHPAYAATFSLIHEIRAGVAGVESSNVRLPVDRTYRLYELWCYLRLLRAISEEFPQFRLDLRSLIIESRRTNGLGVYLLQGQQVIVRLSSEIQLIYQREYAADDYALGKPGALAVNVRPDIAVERGRDTGGLRAVVVLDPKYRTGTALYESVRALHTYRDSIVDGAGSRAVVAAIAITPHAIAPPSGDWRAAPLPDRLFFTSFRASHRLGAVSLRPGASMGAFRALAREIIEVVAV